MAPSTINLTDISTCATDVEYEAFNVSNSLWHQFDILEYVMGLERGDMANYESQPCATIQMPKDMVALYTRARWALLPTIETTKTIIEMCVANLKAPTKERTHFTKFLPETEYTYTFLPVATVTDKSKLQPIYVNGDACPFTDFPLVKTTLHPCFLRRSTQLYTVLHASICDTAGIATSEHKCLTLALITQMNKPINLSWFAGTTGMFPHRQPFYNPRPDPTPESDSADRALRWFQENIGDAPSDPDESDLRLLRKMSAWHSAVAYPSDGNEAKKAYQDLLEENILTDEESDRDESDGSGTTPYESSIGAGTAHENLPIPGRYLKLSNQTSSSPPTSMDQSSDTEPSSSRKRGPIGEENPTPTKLPRLAHSDTDMAGARDSSLAG